jgi:outer membrane lipoprotein SlyB
MSGIVDDVIYYLAAPLRLFGRSRGFRLASLAVIVVGVFFAATLWALDSFFPSATPAAQVVAKLEPLPPLQPLTRASYVIAPVAVSLAAIQRSLEASAPRTMTGKGGNPVSSILSKADIGMTITRGNMAVNGRAGEMTVLTQLNGSLKITGQLASQAGNLTGGAVGGIAGLLDGALGKDLGKAVGGIAGKVLDQNVELRSQVTVRSKPSVTANWRLQPNLAAQVAVSDSTAQVAGIRINMASEARPLIERAVNEQVAALEGRLRNDPSLERAAREQWIKMCRSIPLGGGTTGLPQLWLEMRPVRAAAAQPQIDARNVTLAVGIEANTRITPKESKPDCPFPATLDLVPPMDNGKLSIGLPIDVPFTELNKLLDIQLKGKRFPEGTNAPVEVEVRSASLAASDDRLLIALKVKAHERKSWFGFGAEASINIWGKPRLDPGTQVLSLTDISLAVESEAAFGLLGTAARAAMPYLQQALAEKAVIDLTPFLNDARAKIGVALGDFRQAKDGVEVEAAVDNLRLTGIAFDSTTLRVIAEAEGTARVTVSELPRL